jgi:LPXTG-motif cell wall-anchored protein
MRYLIFLPFLAGCESINEFVADNPDVTQAAADTGGTVLETTGNVLSSTGNPLLVLAGTGLVLGGAWLKRKHGSKKDSSVPPSAST